MTPIIDYPLALYCNKKFAYLLMNAFDKRIKWEEVYNRGYFGRYMGMSLYTIDTVSQTTPFAIILPDGEINEQ